MLNLKEFREERRVEHLVPNQFPTLIETCWNMLFLTDWYWICYEALLESCSDLLKSQAFDSTKSPTARSDWKQISAISPPDFSRNATEDSAERTRKPFRESHASFRSLPRSYKKFGIRLIDSPRKSIPPRKKSGIITRQWWTIFEKERLRRYRMW